MKEIQEKINLHCTDALIEKVKILIQELDKWSLIEESIMKQKSRAKWIKLGDANTKYFSAVVKERSKRKEISEIITEDSRRLTDSEAIREEFVKYYKSLMGSTTKSLHAISKVIMKRGPILNQQQRVDMCAPITEMEIVQALRTLVMTRHHALMDIMLSFSRKHGALSRKKL